MANPKTHLVLFSLAPWGKNSIAVQQDLLMHPPLHVPQSMGTLSSLWFTNYINRLVFSMCTTSIQKNSLNFRSN